MFEKFTERCRKVMSLSRQEAQRLQSEFIGAEHILLGILQEGGGTAAQALKNLNVSLKQAYFDVAKLIRPSTSPSVALGQLPFSPQAFRVIKRAGEAASSLAHDIIGTEHMLLGLLQDDGIAGQALREFGLNLAEVRKRILLILAQRSQQQGDSHSPDYPPA